jgi:hypothetical protein
MEENKETTDDGQPTTDHSGQDKQQVNNETFNENISSTDPGVETEQSLNLKPLNDLNDNMEVHHHSHAAHGKKTWKNYFWEFLMLFLAVFCGFLAEYQLEHVIEHNREKEYMQSLIEDLETDSEQLNTYIGWRRSVDEDFDSLVTLLKKPDRNDYAYGIYLLSNRTTLRFGLPDISERTINQLKNAGGLRLVRNTKVSNAINRHYLDVNRMKSVFETERLVRLQLLESKDWVLDGSLVQEINKPSIDHASFKLFTDDHEKINHFLNKVLAAKLINRSFITQLDSAKNNSNRLAQLIQEEYQEGKNKRDDKK